MTSATDISRRRAAPALGTFERYLTLWVALCILAGIVLGRLVPGPFQALGRMTVAEVNIPVAVLIWLMNLPILLKVDFGALHRVAEQWRATRRGRTRRCWPRWRELVLPAIERSGPIEAWIIDDTGFPKKGRQLGGG